MSSKAAAVDDLIVKYRCWTTGKQLSLIDRTQENARQKLRDIVALAYDSLHPELKARFLVDRANAGQFGVRFHEYERLRSGRSPSAWL